MEIPEKWILPPEYSRRERSLSIAIDSDIFGIDLSPKILLLIPSFTSPVDKYFSRGLDIYRPSNCFR